MYEKEISTIIDASENNALTFFVGAGVSALSDAPTWKELIHSICDQMHIARKQEYSSDDCLRIPQMFYYAHGQDEYYRLVEEKINVDLSPNKIHKEMLSLHPISFITTNYDTLIEDAAISACQTYKVIACDEDVPQIFGDRFILKMHGDFAHRNIVLKEEDYLNYSKSFMLIETLVKSIFATNTVVFIGYGLGDYNIKLILNWVKTLLGDNFRKPIFIYTDNEVLSPDEIRYHESRGLSVIDYHLLISSPDSFMARYQAVFTEIKKASSTTLFGKTDDEAFELLFSALEPLDHLEALRLSDIQRSLSGYGIHIYESGQIYAHPDDNNLLTKFLALNQLSTDEKSALPKPILNKYQTIVSSFSKARLLLIHYNDNKYRIGNTEDHIFADKNVLLFNYKSIESFTRRQYTSIQKNYRKAYYLSCLYRYDEAFLLFYDVAKRAFAEKNYLLYYLSMANCISLHKLLENNSYYYPHSTLENIDSFFPNEREISTLFDDLPVEFRNKYPTIRDMHSANMLNRFSNEAFRDSQKLLTHIETNSEEFGITSSDKAFCIINDYLHFMIRNGIVDTIFTEFREPVKNLMTLLVYEDARQQRIILHEKLFPHSRHRLQFDEIDFFCFVNFFKDNELSNLFQKHHIDTFIFEHMSTIEEAIKNLLDSYDTFFKPGTRSSVINAYEKQIASCLTLLRYVDISQQLVDKICVFLFSHEFQTIKINHKVMFLGRQVYHRKKYSKATTTAIENQLVCYIDQAIDAHLNGTSFGVDSSSSGIDYFDLLSYLYPKGETTVSRRLSIRIGRIIKYKMVPEMTRIGSYFGSMLTTGQQNKIITWAKASIYNSFSFGLFELLLHCKVNIDADIITLLQQYLRESIKQEHANAANKDKVVVYPERKPYKDLITVGHFCAIDLLSRKDFSEFIGICAEYDFFMQMDAFDFEQFDVSWLLNLTDFVLGRISDYPVARVKIRSAIATILLKKDIDASDQERLKEILIHHFCQD